MKIFTIKGNKVVQVENHYQKRKQGYTKGEQLEDNKRKCYTKLKW